MPSLICAFTYLSVFLQICLCLFMPAHTSTDLSVPTQTRLCFHWPICYWPSLTYLLFTFTNLLFTFTDLFFIYCHWPICYILSLTYLLFTFTDQSAIYSHWPICYFTITDLYFIYLHWPTCYLLSLTYLLFTFTDLSVIYFHWPILFTFADPSVIYLSWPITAVRLLRFSSLLWPLLPKPQQQTATCCLCCPWNIFIGELFVSLVRIKHTVYNNVIGQLLI